jgi:hypothetical protein
MIFRSRILAAKLLKILEQQSSHGRCHFDCEHLVWSIANRWPRSPRPKLFQLELALRLLEHDGRIVVQGDFLGGRCAVLTGEKDGKLVAGQKHDYD